MPTRLTGLRPMIITQRFMLVRVAILFANRSRRWSNVWIESDLCERIAQPSLTWIGLAKLAKTRERQSWSFGAVFAYLSAGGGARAWSNYYDCKRSDRSLLLPYRPLIHSCRGCRKAPECDTVKEWRPWPCLS